MPKLCWTFNIIKTDSSKRTTSSRATGRKSGTEFFSKTILLKTKCTNYFQLNQSLSFKNIIFVRN